MGLNLGMKKINNKIIYDLNYIRQNIDLKKFCKLLKIDTKYNIEDPRLTVEPVVKSAIKSCVNIKNKDPNLKDLDTSKFKFNDEFNEVNLHENFYIFARKMHHKNKKNELLPKWFFLEFYCFYPDKDSSFHSDLKPTKFEMANYKNFIKEVDLCQRNGTLLTKISNNFKLIYNFEFFGESKSYAGRNLKIKNKKDHFDTNSLIYSNIDKNYYYIWNNIPGLTNAVVKIFNKKLTKKHFFEEIIKFKEVERNHTGIDLYKDGITGIDYYDLYKKGKLK